MAELITIARPYAKAAFQYALDSDKLELWSLSLAKLAQVVGLDQVETIVKSPKVSSEEKVALLKDLVGDVDRNFTGLLSLLINNQRLLSISEISVLFDALKADYEKTLEVEIVSAVAIPDTIKDAIATSLKGKLGRQVTLDNNVNKAVIGGALIKAGDVVIDGTVKGKLQRLADSLVH